MNTNTLKTEQAAYAPAANDPAPPTPLELLHLAQSSEGAAAQVTPLFTAENFQAGRYLTTNPPPRRWLIKDVIPAGIVFALVAPGGTGKTMASLQLGVSCATGLPFAGMWEVGEAGAVLMLLGEDDDAELHRRIYNISTRLDENDLGALALLGKNLYIKSVVGEDNLMTTSDARSKEVGHTALVDRLILTAAQIPNLKLIVIDPASRFRGGDENSAPDTTRFVQALERVTQATGAALMLIHHTNKGSMNTAAASQSAARGSSALTDGVRLQINLATLNKEANKRYRFADEDLKRYVTLSITKTNYSAPQNDILLQRGEGGYLSGFEPSGVLKTPTRSDTEILKLIRTEIAQGKRYTKTGFVKKFCGPTGRFKMGNNALREQLECMISDGIIALDGRYLG